MTRGEGGRREGEGCNELREGGCNELGEGGCNELRSHASVPTIYSHQVIEISTDLLYGGEDSILDVVSQRSTLGTSSGAASPAPKRRGRLEQNRAGGSGSVEQSPANASVASRHG